MQYSCLKPDFSESPSLLEQVHHWMLQVPCLVSPPSLTLDHRGIVTGDACYCQCKRALLHQFMSDRFSCRAIMFLPKRKLKIRGDWLPLQSCFGVWTSNLCRNNFIWNILLFAVDDRVFLVSLLVLPFSTTRIVSSDTLFLQIPCWVTTRKDRLQIWHCGERGKENRNYKKTGSYFNLQKNAALSQLLAQGNNLAGALCLALSNSFKWLLYLVKEIAGFVNNL